MNYKIKDIKKAIRDLSNIIDDMLNANHETYQALTRRFVLSIREDSIVNQIVKPLLDIEIDTKKILIRDTPEGGWGHIELPTDMTEHLAFVLQLFCYFEDESVSVRNFANQYYRQRNFDQNIYIFNDQVVRPAFRELMQRLDDFIQEELNEREDEMTYQSNFQIFKIGDIHTGGGSVAIGQDIRQEIVSQGFIEKYIKELIELGVTIEQIDKVRPIIDEIDAETRKETIDKSRFKQLLSDLYQHGKELMIKAVITTATKPEVIEAATEFLESLG